MSKTRIMKIYLLTLLSLAFIPVLAQLPELVHENFNSNTYGWSVSSGANYSYAIKNGKYILITTEEGHGRYATIKPFIDYKKEFSLEATFLQKSGSDNNGFGLLWGGDGAQSYHTFVITSNGYYQVMSPETHEGINAWVSSTLPKPLGQENHLRVDGRSGKLHFFINGTEVFQCAALPWYGSNIGMVNYTNMELEMDNFIFRHDVRINLPEGQDPNIVKENLGPLVNSEYEDLSPKITADGRTIYFARQRSPENIGGIEDGEDIWYSTLDDQGQWTRSRNLGVPVNTELVNNLASVSTDNNTLLLHVFPGFSFRRRTETGWSDLQDLGISFNNESGNLEACLSPDGKAIIFSAKLKGNVYYQENVTERDLYVCLKKKDTWGEPMNLGRVVNTAGNEMSPFLAADGKTLYFGSDGHPGFGNTDIFVTKRLSDSWTDWEVPVNLGRGINTFEFDAFYTIPASGEYGYMVSNHNSIGLGDIIRFKLPQAIKPDPIVLVLGKVLNANTKKPVEADIVFEDLSTQTEKGEAFSNPATGEYRIALPYGINYGVHAKAKGYLSVNENLELISINQYAEVEKNLFLVPIETGQAIQLNNVFFEQGKPILKAESYPELDRLAEILEDNPRIEIELGGHTDNVGNPASLTVLSQDRVATVKSYLVKKGIKASRITGRGYGSSKPIVPNDTEEHRRMNRRVEFKITKK